MSAFRETPFGPADHIDLESTPLAVIRHEGMTIADLRDAFDGGYRAIGTLFADGVLAPAGPAIAIYHGDPMATFDLELGFPVGEAPDSPIEAGGFTVTTSALPTGPATATTFFGSYEGLGSAWMCLVERARAQGLSPRGVTIEVYVSDPGEAPEALRTDLILPVS